jgi:hypothetical protein
MRNITWNLVKSARLKRAREASFEDLLAAKLIAVKRHPKKEIQHILLFEHKGYIWIVPYVESENEIFLKTLYPSRKYTKLYKEGRLK